MGNYIIVPNADFSEVALGKVSPIDGFRINVVSDDENLGTVSGSGIYVIGNQVTLKATPLTGNVFSCWGDDYNALAERIIVANESMTYTAYFNTDQGYCANLTNDGTFERTNIEHPIYATSTLKRKVDGNIVKIKYPSFEVFDTPAFPNPYQIKIGEYDFNGDWIQRQTLSIVSNGGTVEFTLSGQTDSISICVQLGIQGSIVTQQMKRQRVALVYNSLVIEEGVLNKEDVGSFMYSKLVDYV